MEAPKKLLIVGERSTGKTTLIKSFREHDHKDGMSQTASSSNGTNSKMNQGANGQLLINSRTNDNKFNKIKAAQHPDFSLKILRIDGKKVRVQLWDQGSNLNAQTTFQPLYIRHVAGCVIVANTSNPRSLELAYRWKDFFEKKTKIPNEAAVPICLFINHDHHHKSVCTSS